MGKPVSSPASSIIKSKMITKSYRSSKIGSLILIGGPVLLTFLAILLVMANSANVSAISVYQNVTVTVLPVPMDIHIFSPLNGEIYNDQKIFVNVTSDVGANIIRYYDNGKQGLLCRNCWEYGYLKKKTRAFNEGENNLTVEAETSYGKVNNSVSFFIDSIIPKIMRTMPRTGFASGIFNVSFKEENPDSLFLNIINDENKTENVNLNDCVKSRDKGECSVEVNLSEYDGKEIEYWFNLTDIAGNHEESRIRKLSVDLSKPEIIINNITSKGRNVYFNISIEEKNFDYLGYIDNGRFNYLCKKLDNNNCYKRKLFTYGQHNLTLTAYDRAGNFQEMQINFTITV